MGLSSPWNFAAFLDLRTGVVTVAGTVTGVIGIVAGAEALEIVAGRHPFETGGATLETTIIMGVAIMLLTALPRGPRVWASTHHLEEVGEVLGPVAHPPSLAWDEGE